LPWIEIFFWSFGVINLLKNQSQNLSRSRDKEH
jgi:hypothetical protein